MRVRDLGLALDHELSLSQHVNLICRSCYYQLSQLRVISRSLSHDALVVLVHAFVTSRIDHCCSILVGLPLGVLGRLDRVLRSAARLIGRIPKFGSVSAYMRDVLHWLPVAQRISYRIAALVSRFILGCAPSYLSDLYHPVSDVVARRALRSATTRQLVVPRVRLTARRRRAFSVAGPSIWNDQPSELRLPPLANQTGFYKSLKSVFLCRGWAGSAPE